MLTQPQGKPPAPSIDQGALLREQVSALLVATDDYLKAAEVRGILDDYYRMGHQMGMPDTFRRNGQVQQLVGGAITSQDTLRSLLDTLVTREFLCNSALPADFRTCAVRLQSQISKANAQAMIVHCTEYLKK